MKFLIIPLFLILISQSFADMIFMRESEGSKQIMLTKKNGKTIKLTNGKEAHLYPDISADGKTAVYVQGNITDEGANLEVVFHDLKSNKAEIKSMNVQGMILHPKLSKNGKWLFFSAPFENKNIIWLAQTNLQQLAPAKLFDSTVEGYFPRPSSDGNFVVFQKNSNGKKEIVIYDRIEKESTVIAEGMSPSLSFDERFIAYTSKKDGNWNIYVYDRFAKTTKQVTNDAADEMAPTFSPDGKITFASNRDGSFHLNKLSDDGSWTKLTNEKDADDYAPQYSGETQFRQWTLASFPAPLRSSFGTLFYQNKVYMCGGHSGPEHTYPKESFTNNFDVYDLNTNSWSALAPRPYKAHGYQLAAHGKYIYAFGGFTFEENNNPQWKSLDIIDRYNIETNTWETVGHLNHPRSSNVAITIGTKVYLVGGWDSTPKFKGDYDGAFHSSVEVFDLETEKVSLANYSMPNPLRRAFTGLNYNGKILLVGGLGQGATHFELVSNLTLLDPVTGSFEELPPLPFATFAPAAEMIGNELFVFGGMFKTGTMDYEYVSHIYAYNFTKKEWRHTGRSLQETKGFSQVFKLAPNTIGILGGHHYFEGEDSPVNTFELFFK